MLGRADRARQLCALQRGVSLAVLGRVPDGACAVGAVELHVQPALHLPLDGEGGAGHGARVFVLLRVHAAVHAARAPARGRAGVERLPRDGAEHGAEFRAGVSLPELRGLPQLAGQP